jgi:putative redox protein
MNLVIESAGDVASQVRIGSHTLVFDQPTAVGGADRGPSPLDVLAASVGACAHYFAAAALKARGIPTAELRVDLSAEKATSGPKRLASVRLDVHLPAGVTDRVQAAVERAVLECPAWGTLRGSPEMSLEFHRSGEPVRAAG